MKPWQTNLDEVVALVKELSSPNSGWTWALNSRCKYVDIRIDMRDGAFVLVDRHGGIITEDDLRFQHRAGKDGGV